MPICLLTLIYLVALLVPVPRLQSHSHYAVGGDQHVWEWWCRTGRSLLSCEASCCSHENTTLHLPFLCLWGSSSPAPPGLNRYTLLRLLSNNTISRYFQLPLMAQCASSTFRKCQKVCLCEPKALAAKQHLEKPVGLFTAWLESLCTCWVAFCTLWMIAVEDRVCTALCYTSIMWQDMLILNWKFKWEMCRVLELMNSKRLWTASRFTATGFVVVTRPAG